MTIRKKLVLGAAAGVVLLSPFFLFGGPEETEAVHTKEAGEPKTLRAESITLKNEGGGRVSWVAVGSPNAFKLVWSKNPDPTYPPRKEDKANYHSSKSTSDTLTGFDGDGLYYVRVCEYLDGACGVYSNQVTVNLGSEEKVLQKKVKKTVEKKESGEADKAFLYFNNFFARLKKVSLSRGTQPSMIITPQGEVTIIDGELTVKEEEVLTVKIWGLSFEIDASGADIDGGSGALDLEDLETNDRLLVKGEMDDGVVKAAIIHDRSARLALVERLESEIASLLEKISRLQEQLRGLR